MRARGVRGLLLAYAAQVTIVLLTPLIVERSDYAWSNLLFPLWLNVAGHLGGGAVGQFCAHLLLGLLGPLSLSLSRMDRKPLRLSGILVFSIVLFLDFGWFTTESLRRCC